MKTIHIDVYEFDELDESAKEKARAWYRKGALDYYWWNYLFEDAERIGLKITEFDLGNRKHIKGHLTRSIADVCSAILKEHGKTCDTYKLAEEWAGCTDEEQEGEFLQALLEEYFVLLDREYEYLLSDECVDETIKANEYTFTEDGTRAKPGVPQW